MAITKNEPDFKKSTYVKIKEFVGDYSILALCIAVFTGLNYFITWNAVRYIEKAERQAEANYRIGILEGKIESLSKKCNVNVK